MRRDGADWIADADLRMRLLDSRVGELRFAVDGLVRRVAFARDGDALWLDFEGVCRRFADLTYAPPRRDDAAATGAVLAPVSGVVVAVEAKAGDAVRRGQALATLEAMKMQYAILAPIDGVIAEAHAVAGAPAQARALLFSIAPQETLRWTRPIVTCALTGVLTDPRRLSRAGDAGTDGARGAGRGRRGRQRHPRAFPPSSSRARAICRPGSREVARAVVAAIRDACPDVVINQTTGIVGPDISGPVACLRAVRPEIAALNAGSLNYLKTRADGGWAWPPMLFDNPVEKIAAFLAAMNENRLDAGVRMFRHRHRAHRGGDRAQQRL